MNTHACIYRFAGGMITSVLVSTFAEFLVQPCPNTSISELPRTTMPPECIIHVHVGQYFRITKPKHNVHVATEALK